MLQVAYESCIAWEVSDVGAGRHSGGEQAQKHCVLVWSRRHCYVTKIASSSSITVQRASTGCTGCTAQAMLDFRVFKLRSRVAGKVSFRCRRRRRPGCERGLGSRAFDTDIALSFPWQGHGAMAAQRKAHERELVQSTRRGESRSRASEGCLIWDKSE